MFSPGAPGVSSAVRPFSTSLAVTGGALPGSAQPATCTSSGRPGAGRFAPRRKPVWPPPRSTIAPPSPFIGRPGSGAVDRLRPRRRVARARIDQQVLQPAVHDQRRGMSARGQGLDQDLAAPHGAGVMPAAASRPRVSVSGKPTTLE